MKITLFILFLATKLISAGLEKNMIIPKFYELLARNEKPSVSDEEDFFGGDESSPVKELVISIDKYKNSKTPTWDYIRDNKYFFITKNLQELANASIQYSSPVRMTRLWNLSEAEYLVVYVHFPTKSLGPKKGSGSTGITIVRFKLGTDRYLNIDETFIVSSEKLFYEYVYTDAKKN